VLISLLLVGIIVGAAAFFWLNTLLAQTHTKEGVQAVSAIQVAKTVPLPKGKDPVPPKPGATNILVLGSDMRSDQPETYGRSDTMMIVHVDPDANYASILSMPRDLRIDLGRHGYQKLNAAYAFGGVPLTIQTIRELTGLTIDKYVHIDFDAFRKVTTQVGGIYVDVDRRYYSNSADYEHVDIQPGYQKLAGAEALQYVRFRHDLNSDWGRIDRQQYYLRSAKEQGITLGNATKLKSVVEAAASNISTDLSGYDIFKLAWWGVRLPSGRVKQVNLQGRDQYVGGIAYVLAGDDDMQRAVDELMSPPSRGAPSTGGAHTATSVTATTVPSSTPTTKAPAQPAAASRRIDLDGVSVERAKGGGRSRRQHAL
jgi:LCP family protein required for cell wall assembly